MTSRLKHKLDIENINVKSKYLNESFVQIGTPLPALADNKKDKLEYVPEWNQEVRDEQGRRRFHGAFTGGFSAGYYNTVGSKEGWTPSTFKSSRTNRAQHRQRAEDFMDEEDLAAMREDRTLSHTETFRSDRIGSTQDELAHRMSGSNILDSLIAPAKSSIGEKLLQKQGWKVGQGIGPRVSLRRLKRQEQKLGLAHTESTLGMDVDGDAERDTEEDKKHTYAPRDVKLLVFPNKEDQHGLGFTPGMGGGIQREAALRLRANHVQVDNDGDDAYGMDENQAGPSTFQSRSKLHYAFDDADDDPVVIGGPSSSNYDTAPNGKANTTSDIDTTRYHDGRPVLPGFELDPLGAPPDKWFALPEVPPDWRPRPARVWGTTRKWDEEPGMKRETVVEDFTGKPGLPLSIQQRGSALGEPAVPDHLTSAAKSVFEFMSEKERDRLQSFIANAKAATSTPTGASADSALISTADFMTEKSTEVTIPPLSPRTAGAALRGFVPYGDDLPKQDRYKSYLTSQTHNTSQPNPILRKGTIEEINNELADFASSARIFRPMSYAMSNRFTSGSASLAVSDMQQAKPGLHLYDAEKAAATAAAADAAKRSSAVVEEKKNLTPREQAAKDGKYGPLTRVVNEFYPTKLICRRFGVQDPHPEGEPKEIQTGASTGTHDYGSLPLPRNDASWESAFVHQGATDSISAVEVAPAGDDEQERVPTSLAEVGMPGDANQGRDTLTYTKPSIDIFKAIFADEDDDDDDGEEDLTAAQLVARQNEKRAADRKRKLDEERQKREEAIKNEGPVDLATFKPVFVRRLNEHADPPVEADGIGIDGASKAESKEQEKDKEKKKRKKDKKQKRGVLSFGFVDDEDQGEGGEEWVEKKISKPNKPVADKDKRGGEAVNVAVAASRDIRVQADAHGDDLCGSAAGEGVAGALASKAAARKSAADFM